MRRVSFPMLSRLVLACLAGVALAQPGAAPPPPAVELEGWGLPENGLQLGLFPGAEQREFHYGDTLTLVTRARNTGNEPLDLSYAPPGDPCYIGASPGNRLRLDVTPGRDPQVLSLEPGEEQPVPALESRVRLEPPGDRGRDPGAQAPDETVGLLPGEYTVEFPYPIWLLDLTNPDRHTAHRARPGVARFTVLDDPANPWIVERICYDAAGSPRLRREIPARPDAPVQEGPAPAEAVFPQTDPPPPGVELNQQPVAWGELVNGLQAGIRLEATPGLDPTVPGEGPPGRLTFGFYLRNCTNRPLLLAVADLDLGGGRWDDSDWSPEVQDGAGNQVEVTLAPVLLGRRTLQTHLLVPGQCLRVASLRLLLRDKAASLSNDLSILSMPRPMALVEPGRYTVSCCVTPSWAAGRRLQMVLPTGRAAFEVTASALGRQPGP